MAKRGTIPKKTGEIWKPVLNERNSKVDVSDYWVSNIGRVRHGKRLLHQKLNNDGYYVVWINKYRRFVHRLVANAFVPNPHNLDVVDHIDGQKLNNNSTNLRWVTVQENTQAAYDLGLIKRSEIVAIDEDDYVFLYKTQTEAARDTGVSKKTVNMIIKGLVNSAKGWRFFRMKGLTDKRGKGSCDANGVEKK